MINKIKWMKRISLTIITFFYFVFAFFLLAKYSGEPFRNDFNNFLDATTLNLSELMLIFLIFSILFVEVIPLINNLNLKKFVFNNQKFFIDYYPSLSLFLAACGLFISFIGAISKFLFFVQLGILFFYVGLLSWVIMFNIKIYIESQIFYAIHEANRRISTIDPKEPYQIKQFIRFISLTLNNINLKFGRKIKLNISESEIHQFETLKDYLPYYIKIGSTRELDKLKDHIERMSKSVGSDNSVSFKIFTNELIQLSNEMIYFFKDNNLKIIHRSSALNFIKDVNNIKTLLIIASMLFYLIISILFIFGKLTLSDLQQIPRP